MTLVKKMLASAGDVREVDLIPGSGDPLEEDMATHSSILAWRIPWKWGRKESDTIEQLSTAQHTYQWRRQELKSVQQTLFLTF